MRVRRDLGRDLREHTAKKKESTPSPYDLENANQYLRNTFKMEVIMSLEEQRKQRPAKYKIKNIKRVKRHPSIKRTRNHANEGHGDVSIAKKEQRKQGCDKATGEIL